MVDPRASGRILAGSDSTRRFTSMTGQQREVTPCVLPRSWGPSDQCALTLEPSNLEPSNLRTLEPVQSPRARVLSLQAVGPRGGAARLLDDHRSGTDARASG
jgi:hypothetical protein